MSGSFPASERWWGFVTAWGMIVGLLCFLFFVGPWFALAFWVWRETGGLAVSKRALLGDLGPDGGSKPAAATAATPPPAI